jgi:hypothetical protein
VDALRRRCEEESARLNLIRGIPLRLLAATDDLDELNARLAQYTHLGTGDSPCVVVSDTLDRSALSVHTAAAAAGVSTSSLMMDRTIDIDIDVMPILRRTATEIDAAVDRIRETFAAVLENEFLDNLLADVSVADESTSHDESSAAAADPTSSRVLAWGAMTSELVKIKSQLACLEEQYRELAEEHAVCRDRARLDPLFDDPAVAMLSPISSSARARIVGTGGSGSPMAASSPAAPGISPLTPQLTPGQQYRQQQHQTPVAAAEQSFSLDSAARALDTVPVPEHHRAFVAAVLDLRRRMARSHFTRINSHLGGELSFVQIMQLSNSNLEAIAARAAGLTLERASSRGTGVDPAALDTGARILSEQVARLLIENAGLRRQINDYVEIATEATRAKAAAFEAQFG